MNTEEGRWLEGIDARTERGRMTQAMTLAEFLLARIAEDWASARAVQSDNCDLDAPVSTGDDPWPSERAFADRITPARVLAECESKRRIVNLHPIYRGKRIQPIDTSGTDYGCELCHRLDALHSDSLIEAVGYCDTLLALAMPYADHPDYNEAWRLTT